jgi:hypothetical protein
MEIHKEDERLRGEEIMACKWKERENYKERIIK